LNEPKLGAAGDKRTALPAGKATGPITGLYYTQFYLRAQGWMMSCASVIVVELFLMGCTNENSPSIFDVDVF
jgi:hypothetical protein